MLAALLWMGATASAQANAPAQGSAATSDTTQWQLATMDQFMETHPEIAEQLRKDPSLMKNDDFVQKHQALQQFLQQHPGVREEFSENPNAFMHQEQVFDRGEDAKLRSTQAWHLQAMDQFLDSHPEIAEQLRKNPSLVNNEEFVEKHPELQQFLQQHPGVRQAAIENPNAFMQKEQNFDRTEEAREGAPGPARMTNLDQFLDSHPEIAEQLRKNPSLINDRDFDKKHPALQQFLQQNPGMREEFRENPNAFMQQEQRFDAHADVRAGSMPRGAAPGFSEFLEGHSQIAQELSKNPSLASNKEFLEDHPELREFLKTHPGVKEELAENPQAALGTAQASGANSTTAGTTAKLPGTEAKAKPKH